MLMKFCKSCQYCLEAMYWNCCEEKYCFDEKIATYKLDDDSAYSNGFTNMGASLDSVVTDQPANNNHLPQNAIIERETHELPMHADKLYEVFTKSLIFRDEHELKAASMDSLDELETKSEPDYIEQYSAKPNRTKVYFEDEVNSPVTDFEIMFKDELFSNHEMFQINEEEETPPTEKRSTPDSEDGLVMNVSLRKSDVVKPSTVTIKDDSKLTTQNSVYQYDPSITVMSLPSTLSIPKVENLKGILRQKSELPRSHSTRTLERVDMASRLKPNLNRVESLKNIDPGKINKVLSRVPFRSASYLNIPEHLMPAKPQLVKSKSTIGVSMSLEDELKSNRLSDTPIIKSNNLPRFFADSPTILEYKEETSLQRIKQQSILRQDDYSMPRFYGTVKTKPEPVHQSTSMPDLTNPTSTGKVSKRLVKLRSKLKPLVIKKGTEEKL